MSKLKQINIAESDEKLYQQILGGLEKVLKSNHYQPNDASNDPASQEYAAVKVNGKTVAEIDNHGFVKGSNSLGASIRELFSNEGTHLSGPQLAQHRAEKTAQLLGGEVVKSSTAMTQAQFKATPPPSGTADSQAMAEDPIYEMMQSMKAARTLFLAQLAAQTSVEETEAA